MATTIKLFIIDSSANFICNLKNELESTSKIEIVGSATDPTAIPNLIKNTKPQAIIVDVDMVKYLVGFDNKIPVVITGDDDLSNVKFDKFSLYAVAKKPREGASLKTFSSFVATKIIVLLSGRGIKADVQNSNPSALDTTNYIKKLKPAPKMPSSDEILGLDKATRLGYVVALGASTGGTEALECVIKSFPKNMPPVVVVQHMPPAFTKLYADRLDKFCDVNVMEATDEYRLKQGDCVIAAGGYQMQLKKDSKGYFIKKYVGEKVSGHSPSVDVLFTSVAEVCKDKTVAVLMTGMGADGAKGLLKIKNNGAFTIGQDEESCIVYGMPMEAYKLGACTVQLPLTDIGKEICRKLSNINIPK